MFRSQIVSDLLEVWVAEEKMDDVSRLLQLGRKSRTEPWDGLALTQCYHMRLHAQENTKKTEENDGGKSLIIPPMLDVS